MKSYIQINLYVPTLFTYIYLCRINLKRTNYNNILLKFLIAEKLNNLMDNTGFLIIIIIEIKENKIKKKCEDKIK